MYLLELRDAYKLFSRYIENSKSWYSSIFYGINSDYPKSALREVILSNEKGKQKYNPRLQLVDTNRSLLIDIVFLKWISFIRQILMFSKGYRVNTLCTYWSLIYHSRNVFETLILLENVNSQTPQRSCKLILVLFDKISE